MVGPGARKPSVGEGIESRRPLFCSGITTLHSLFIYLFFLSFIFTFASILVCVNNNNNYVTAEACPTPPGACPSTYDHNNRHYLGVTLVSFPDPFCARARNLKLGGGERPGKGCGKSSRPSTATGM